MAVLEGNVSIVTGGGSGLGRAIVRRFVAEGSRVGVLERSPSKAADVAAEFGSAVTVRVGDVRSASDNEAVVAETVAAFGRLDTFIGNAGVWDFATPLSGIDLESLGASMDELFDVNVKGYLLGARAALQQLRTSRGSMIFTLSNAAFLPGGGGPLYTASKHAVVGLVRQLAYELENEIRVNGVAPGLMSTELCGLATLSQQDLSLSRLIERQGGAAAVAELSGRGFMPEPDDYVMGYVLLASDSARTTTGTIFEMHGMITSPARAATGMSKPN